MFTTILRLATASGALLLLAACGSADSPRKPPPVEETVFRDLAVTPIEKAKNVENVVMEQKRQTDQALEQNDK